MSQRIKWIRLVAFILLFVVVWLAFAMAFPLSQAFLRAVIVFFIFSLVVGINLRWIIPAAFRHQKFWVYITISLFLSVILAVARLGLETLGDVTPNIAALGRRFPVQGIFFLMFLAQNLFVSLLSLTYFLLKRWIETTQRESLLKAEKLETELMLLKNQVNPHFLFNTLNNIYTLAYLQDQRAPEMILKLSEMMRYLIYECQASVILLEKEVRFLEDYLELQKLKNSRFGNITFQIRGVSGSQYIPPLLLLPFFENLFKHSDLEQNPEGAASVVLTLKDDYLTLESANTYKVHSKGRHESGFGIRNIRKRLKLLYGPDFTLDIEQADMYKISLLIPLKR